MKIKNIFIKLIIIAAAAGTVVCVFVSAVNMYMVRSQEHKIYSFDEADKIEGDYDCIIVLGAGVRPDNTVSDILRDRLETGIAVYEKGAAPKILMSGDHGRINYDEVNVMKDYAVDRGIDSENIFMDHAGFSTYETMYRARDVFMVKKAIIITQKYHMYRALYIADKMGIDAVGVNSDLHTYRGQFYMEAREVLARVKDFMTVIFNPKPKYLGEAIPVSGNGNVTNDKKTE